MQPQGQIIQQGPIVITQNAVSDDRFQQSALARMRVLSYLQIFMGTLCTISGIVLVMMFNGSSESIMSIGYGIWIGGYFIIVGVIGIRAVSSNTRCWIISAMVLNIFCSSVWCANLVGMSAAGITSAKYYTRDYRYRIRYMISDTEASTSYALNGLMVFMGVTELIITIWSAVLCCGAVCRCCKSVQRGLVRQNNPYPMNHPHVVTHGGQPPMAVHSGGLPMTQGQYAYPGGQLQPVGYVAQPQAPPTYYTSAQSATDGSAYQPNKL